MKVLYVGGQKSGKSVLAEQKILEIAEKKPFYIATYDNRTYVDAEMQMRIQKHLQRRKEDFITIEEPLYLDHVIKSGESYLVDCLSMWIMNLLESGEQYETILSKVLETDANMVFVLNDVTKGIIPPNMLSRKYIDLSGVIGQIVAAACDEVYEVVVGLPRRLK
jgi:adenosylcobinamide kinase/adenosylcobinamide-phosphate guanylyltransferase